MDPWHPFVHLVEDRIEDLWGTEKVGDLEDYRHIVDNLVDPKEVVEIDSDRLVGTRVFWEMVHGDQVQQVLEHDLFSPIHLAPFLFDLDLGMKGIQIDVEVRVVRR